ncbi:MAG TPA: 3-hydroxyacyl-ACP dehydratase FabZ [Blastocatellia bacterium]|nr:3-hydroxyacyl-ACP dehydratase FabZ [Blastocatellia bacterium]HMV83184.1 3-hydroxyacyl-ACP dehydratase FabZ [Blastocatellia bacterium]HMX28871.1 3-hydroxyacyl-ACP dehydratase FabZ [Blastocatellia bacterium]HMY72565.1 3-hydroxyacyl-ACP dehydratase FabZ [Blastocatellia bacterium]HMZ20716.1 3-hydroxyacyl-ACP dehydratase FabZ [Blastocatellia bacterium]
MDIKEIQQIIPHRYPMLLIDRIIELDPLKKIVAIKNVTMNEQVFQGHFPGAPVFPGVYIIEAMAQAGAVLLFREVPDRDSKLLFFTGIEEARFRRPVVPGDQLRLEVTVLKYKMGYAKLRAEAFVDGQLAAEAVISSALADKHKK